MDPAPDRWIELGDVTLAVDDRGSGTPPLVLVHGFTGGRVDFADVIDVLADERRVIAYDHRGHAESTNTGDPAGYTIDQLARDLGDLVDALGLERFDLLGHSLGGLVTMRYAATHPERLRSLVLMDTLSEPASIGLEWIGSVVAIGRDQGMGAVADLLAGFDAMVTHVPEDERATVLARVRHKLTAMDVEALDALGAELTGFTPLHPELVDLEIPVTVLVGEHDTPLVPAAHAIAATVGQGDAVVLAGAAHSPQDESRAAWLAAVAAHLDEAATS